MSNENLQKMFVEDAPQQVNELENVRSLSNYVIDLQKLEGEIAKEETLLKQKKERADKISAEVIPEIMESMKLKTLKLQDGSAIEVKEIYSATIPVANREGVLRMRLLFPLVVAKMTRQVNTLALQRVKDINLHKN